jgi:glutamate N-acetyltransferase/amino-acid N-acetyltransferase
MLKYNSKEKYIADLEKRSALPEGFLTSTSTIEFYPKEKLVKNPFKMNLSLITADNETPYFAAMFTRNRFPGAPVILGRERLANEKMKGILINNKVSNVCTPNGKENASELSEALGKELSTQGSLFFPASTGIIGWRLPVDEMKSALPNLVKTLEPGTILNVAKAIMTTDSYPKARRAETDSGSITGTAKGAGMIEPNLATMLVFILTDLYATREELQAALSFCVGRSFNRISIDSDQSTSDTVILLSSGKKKISDMSGFKDALLDVCEGLATDIVRNGEGTAHVMRATVSGNEDEKTLVGIGKAVVNSLLVKTAVFGNDPNVGRIVSSIGDYLGNNDIAMDTRQMTISMGGIVIFDKNAFMLDAASEKRLSDYLVNAQISGTKEKGYPAHDLYVDIDIRFGNGGNKVVIYGSDLSYEYVKENADYRT